jgi:hypothetical protein
MPSSHSSRASHWLASLACFLAAGGIVAGCGSSADTIGGDASADAAPQDGSSSGDGAHDAAPTDGSAQGDAIDPADGPFACGAATCSATQYCENPCCGGAAPPCLPALDAGQCPVGTHADPTCWAASGACREDPCTPPPPFCTDKVPTDPGCTRNGHQIVCMCA